MPDQSHHYGYLAKEQEAASADVVDSTCSPTSEPPLKEQQVMSVALAI